MIMKVRFWGTRGSIPTPVEDCLKYGGNTPCVQVIFEDNDAIFILDAGTGIRQLGLDVMDRRDRMRVYLFLTHFHWDHLQGIPFFAPLYSNKCKCTFIGCDPAEGDLRKKLKDSVCPPYFPVGFNVFKAEINFIDICEGEYNIGNAQVSAIQVNHPGGAVAFKMTENEKAFVYMTDNELDFYGKNSGFHEKLVMFCEGADLFVHDAQYTPDEYVTKKKWGHSSYEEVIHFAMTCGMKRVVLFHHDPEHNDKKIDDIVKNCHTILSKQTSSMECFGAQEGVEFTVESGR
jgi:phosphoribosyl 1,2-cyclic phosphodiesterase